MTSKKDYGQESVDYLKKTKGGYKIVPTRDIVERADLPVVYTPGVGEPVKRIANEVEKRFEYTSAGKTACVITDGSAVLGLGNVGAAAAKPVMEGKASLISNFGTVSALDVCVDISDIPRTDPRYNKEFIKFVKRISCNYSAILLEDIAAPNCFEIEDTLMKELDVPVFHDDQWGAAVVTISGFINALKIRGNENKNMKFVVCGIGAAGYRTAYLLKKLGYNNILPLGRGYDNEKNEYLNVPYTITEEGFPPEHFQRKSHHRKILDLVGSGDRMNLEDALEGADMFIGLSQADLVSREMAKKMNEHPIIFAMANPIPEISESSLEGMKVVYANGRSDCINQLNNVSYFPHALRGLIYSGADRFTEEMALEGAKVIADLVSQEELDKNIIIPSPLDPRLTEVSKKTVEIAMNDPNIKTREKDLDKIYSMIDRDKEELEKRFKGNLN